MDADRGDAQSEWLRQRVLPQFDLQDALARPFGAGLINQTYRVETRERIFVLQQVNRIFSPAIHRNIAAVTECLARAGLVTPRLVPARNGELCVELDDAEAGVWRLMTYVEGSSFDVVGSVEQARSAGALVGRFHAALQGMEHTFVGMREGIHDTPKHLARLRQAVDAYPQHRLHADVVALASDILAAASCLAPLPPLAPRVCHGDLKFNNFIFAGPDLPERDQAVCLIDLDTLGPMSLAYELGDAWRSWCNRAGEDSRGASLDLEVFRASLRGYVSELQRDLSPEERQALLGGPEWISLELAARFAADALCESYFGWDRSRFPAAGEHNLVRARSQWSVFQAFVRTRFEREVMLRA